jgi:methylated-DNA-[protein]-cysteine S-methyltransferase
MDTINYIDYYESPIGLLKISCNKDSLTSLLFSSEKDSTTNPNSITEITKEQLDKYFKGDLTIFNIPLKPNGTAFQKKVWDILVQYIPYGKTTTYKKQALQLGDVKAIRAMASANGKNPIAIVIPCHRVIGSDGSLTGYAGELWRKQWLLQHEAKVCGKWNELF